MSSSLSVKNQNSMVYNFASSVFGVVSGGVAIAANLIGGIVGTQDKNDRKYSEIDEEFETFTKFYQRQRDRLLHIQICISGVFE